MSKEENDRQNDEIRDHMSKGGRANPQSDRIKKELVDESNRDRRGGDGKK